MPPARAQTCPIVFCDPIHACSEPVGGAPDPDYHAVVAVPEHDSGAGPIVRIDKTHVNTHYLTRGYEKFAELLINDGYPVHSFDAAWNPAYCDGFLTFQECKDDAVPPYCQFCKRLSTTNILVVANATTAFAPLELAFLYDWVANYGGRLLLIMDHCPIPGDNPALPALFGISWGLPMPGQTERPTVESTDVFPAARFSGHFCRGEAGVGFCPAQAGSLLHGPVTEGRAIPGVSGCNETVQFIGFWTGSSIEPAADPRLDVARFPDCGLDTDCVTLQGEVAGTMRYVGSGRVFAASEAAMFTAQCKGGTPCPCAGPSCEDEKFGMQPELGTHNQQYLLNIVHWLEGLMPLTCPVLGGCDEGCEPTEDCVVRDLCQHECWDAAAPPPAPSQVGCGVVGQRLYSKTCTCQCPGGGQGGVDISLLCLPIP